MAPSAGLTVFVAADILVGLAPIAPLTRQIALVITISAFCAYARLAGAHSTRRLYDRQFRGRACAVRRHCAQLC